MARSSKKNPGSRSLLRRYRQDLSELRLDAYERAEAARGKRLAKLAKENAAEYEALSRKALRLQTDYEILARKFRSDISKLKKTGIIPKSVKATTARPDRKLNSLLDKFRDVLTGRRRAVPVDKAAARALKRQGYDVAEGRVILSDKYNVSGGRVVQVRAPFEGGTIISEQSQMVPLVPGWEDQIRDMWPSLGDDEYLTIDFGDNFGKVFNRDELDEFLSYIAQYKGREKTPFTYVQILRIPADEIDDYARARMDVKQARARSRSRATSERGKQRARYRKALQRAREKKARLELRDQIVKQDNKRAARKPASGKRKK